MRNHYSPALYHLSIIIPCPVKRSHLTKNFIKERKKQFVHFALIKKAIFRASLLKYFCSTNLFSTCPIMPVLSSQQL